MNSATARALLLAIFAGIVFGFTGCRTQEAVVAESDTPSSGVGGSDKLLEGPARSALEQRFGYERHQIAIPTGDPRTSTILLVKEIPAVEILGANEFDYRILLENLTGNYLTDVVVTEKIPAGLTIERTEPRFESASNGEIRWLLSSIGREESAAIKVFAKSSQAGRFETRTEVTDYRILLPSSVEIVQPKLAVTLSAPSDVLLGDTFTLRVSVKNGGLGLVRNVGLAYAPPSGFSIVEGASEATIELMGQGDEKELSLVLRADVAGPSEHTASVAAKLLNGEISATSESLPVVVRRPQLELAAEGPEEWPLARPGTYRFTVKNTGDGLARDTVVRVPVPAGMEFAEASDEGVLARGAVECAVGSIEPGASKTIWARLRGQEKGIVRLTATAGARGAEEASAESSVKIVGVPAIDIDVEKSEDPLVVGGTVTFTVKVWNRGSAPLTDVTVVCDLDEKMTFALATGPTSCGEAPGSNVTTLKFAPLVSLDAHPSKETAWRVQVATREPGIAKFKTEVTSKEQGPLAEEEKINIMP